MYRMLIVNPGSTSTKIAVFDDLNQVFSETLRHTDAELSEYKQVFDQYGFRKTIIGRTLNENGFQLNTIDAVVGRGGLLKPIESGTYKINELMLKDLRDGVQGQHASNLGGVIAYELAAEYGIESFIVDPVVVDEMEDIARISGIPEISRTSIFHALNQKAVARRYAKEKGRAYSDLNLIVAHMGGGISVGAHKNGRVIDVTNALNGEGPLTPERSGAVPASGLIGLCYSGEYTQEEIKRKIVGKGGLAAYLNTNDAMAVENMISDGDKKAKLIYEAMSYQIAKEIGMYAAVLKGRVDAIILTGGLAYSEYNIERISEMVSFIAEVVVYPGEDEMLALAEGAYRVLSGEEDPKEY